MKFKLKDYHISYKKDLIRNLAAFPSKSPFEMVAEVSASTGCHLLALTYHLQDILGESEAIRERIEELKKFYQIDEVII